MSRKSGRNHWKRVAIRREAAEARQEDHNSLSNEEKLAKAQSRVKNGLGNCAKEIAKLEKALSQDK